MKRFWVLALFFIFIAIQLLAGCGGRSLYSSISKRGPAFFFEGDIGIGSYSYISNVIILENTTSEPILVVMSGHRFGFWHLSPYEEKHVGFRDIYGQVSFTCKFTENRNLPHHKIYMDFDRGPYRRRISISYDRCWCGKDNRRHRWWWK